jgi:hypothetical protein
MNSFVGHNVSLTWLITMERGRVGGKIDRECSFSYSSSLAYGPFS